MTIEEIKSAITDIQGYVEPKIMKKVRNAQ